MKINNWDFAMIPYFGGKMPRHLIASPSGFAWRQNRLNISSIW
jgi:hypothetical protein